MKRLFCALVLVPLLTACLATQQAVTQAHLASETALAAAAQAKAMAENPDVTQAELDGAIGVAVAKAKEAADAAIAIGDAIKEDAANARAGFTGLGKTADGGLISLALTALAWLGRDRRKRQGLDPLQRADVPTPPTTV
ncbi:MAG: hypothetical protein V3S20_06485 [Dehalococcoidia bacterium]